MVTAKYDTSDSKGFQDVHYIGETPDYSPSLQLAQYLAMMGLQKKTQSDDLFGGYKNAKNFGAGFFGMDPFAALRPKKDNVKIEGGGAVSGTTPEEPKPVTLPGASTPPPATTPPKYSPVPGGPVTTPAPPAPPPGGSGPGQPPPGSPPGGGGTGEPGPGQPPEVPPVRGPGRPPENPVQIGVDPTADQLRAEWERRRRMA